MLPIKPINPLHLSAQNCTLGCPILDSFLDGGIPCNSITEIVSESGCGKTQLCLQLLLTAQLPISLGGLCASSLFFHSEFPFPFRRLRQLCLSFSSSSHSNPLDRIFVHPVESPLQFLSLLSRLESLLSSSSSSSYPIKLIVIDSIAAMFRSDFDNNASDMKKRSSLFFKIAGKLKSLARDFGLAVVVTNQVMDVMDSDRGIGNFGCLYSSGRRVSPALGLSWANCINSRLFLSRCDDFVGNPASLSGSEGTGVIGITQKRKMQVVFAPHLPESCCEFVILREGVFGISS